MDRQIEKQGTILGSAYSSEYNKRTRDNAIAALGVSSLLSATQGQLANAKMKAEKAVNEKYDPIQEQIDALIKNLDLIKNDPATSLEDKNRAQAQLDIQNAKKEQLALEKENAAQIWDIANNAGANGQMFKATAQYPTLSTALTAIQQSQTKEQALQIAVSSGLLFKEEAEKNLQIIGGSEMGYYSVDKDGKVNSLLKGTGNTSGDKEQKAKDAEFEKFAKQIADQVYNGTIKSREEAKTRIESYYPDYNGDVIYELVKDNYKVRR
jgi:hypothetical protein